MAGFVGQLAILAALWATALAVARGPNQRHRRSCGSCRSVRRRGQASRCAWYLMLKSSMATGSESSRARETPSSFRKAGDVFRILIEEAGLTGHHDGLHRDSR